MTCQRRVLVTDGEQRAALAITRSLGRTGSEVWVGAASRWSLAGSSRYAAGRVTLPDPLAAPVQYTLAVEAAVRRLGCQLLLPVTEGSLLALLGARERFGECVLPFPDLMTFRAVNDKAAVLAAARKLGIAVPEQVELVAPSTGIDTERLRFPVVVKPGRSVSEDRGGSRRKFAVHHAATPAELERVLTSLPPAAYPLLLQERIVGPGTGIFLLLWNGELVARFAHRRIREKPPSGGISTCCESVPADPELVSRSLALLQWFGWCGVAMVEYKRDSATGTPYLMEINGRFWGSLQLAVDAGVDFPALLAAVGSGERPAAVTAYRIGVRSRWWWGEVDHLLARLRRSDAELSLPPDAPARAEVLRAILRPGSRTGRNEILRWEDPLPFVTESVQWLRGR